MQYSLDKGYSWNDINSQCGIDNTFFSSTYIGLIIHNNIDKLKKLKTNLINYYISIKVFR